MERFLLLASFHIGGFFVIILDNWISFLVSNLHFQNGNYNYGCLHQHVSRFLLEKQNYSTDLF